MIIYEVNLSVSSDIFSEYFQWLKPHVDIMLKFKGFTRATILREVSENDNTVKKISVQYEIQTMRDLNDYLDNFAEQMRAEALKKFGTQFSATRRILVQA